MQVFIFLIWNVVFYENNNLQNNLCLQEKYRELSLLLEPLSRKINKILMGLVLEFRLESLLKTNHYMSYYIYEYS